ncbi:MAG: glycosyltransferase [Fibrobacter sp.]|nr:glycosyltransferase [Fibrobacter sp.]
MSQKISVVMAVYNGEKYLREQLDSIYAQSLKPFEVIVVDDCSTDNSFAILKEYADLKGLRCISNEKNLGVNATFAKAISLATCDLIAISDQDDVWFDCKLEKLYQAISSMPANEPNLVTSAVTDVDSNLNVVYKRNISLRPISFSDFIPDLFMQGSTQLFNKQLKDLLRIAPKGTYDLQISTTASLCGNRKFITEPLGYYRHHDKNVVASWNYSKLGRALRHNLRKHVLDYGVPNAYITLFLKPKYEEYKSKIPDNRSAFFEKIISVNENIFGLLTIGEWSSAKRIRALAGTLALHFFRR